MLQLICRGHSERLSSFTFANANSITLCRAHTLRFFYSFVHTCFRLNPTVYVSLQVKHHSHKFFGLSYVSDSSNVVTVHSPAPNQNLKLFHRALQQTMNPPIMPPIWIRTGIDERVQSLELTSVDRRWDNMLTSSLGKCKLPYSEFWIHCNAFLHCLFMFPDYSVTT